MLDVGKKRAERLGYQSDEVIDVDWVCGDAEKLPFEDNQFTAYTIAFGIRNVTNVQNALNEAHRVLKVSFKKLNRGHNSKWLFPSARWQIYVP